MGLMDILHAPGDRYRARIRDEEQARRDRKAEERQDYNHLVDRYNRLLAQHNETLSELANVKSDLHYAEKLWKYFDDLIRALPRDTLRISVPALNVLLTRGYFLARQHSVFERKREGLQVDDFLTKDLEVCKREYDRSQAEYSAERNGKKLR
jgi:hypothetical protein